MTACIVVHVLIILQHMSFDRNILSTHGSGIDTMQSSRFYACDTLLQLEIKNFTLEQPVLVENNINEAIKETQSHSDNTKFNSSVQLYHVFNVTSEEQRVQIQITPLKPNKRYQVFVSYEDKPTDTLHDWKGILPVKRYSVQHSVSEQSTILPKKTVQRLGTYYALVLEGGKFLFNDKNAVSDKEISCA